MNDERLDGFGNMKTGIQTEEKRLKEELGDLRAARMQNWHIRNRGLQTSVVGR